MRYLILFALLLTGCATTDVCVDKDGKQVSCPKEERPERPFREPRGGRFN